ncbi:HpcH/HpaI aldolase family protein [Teichococcus oryzae]|uniref:2,4-dihydroxyhept-2-ene-1,7-dioic acid aldolase n=1 Tax=Teichococcus oryzae TaxID=1608942 RepID=A0A5B2TDL5_9PROT|nr:aldolase/citrate lyase family protein [Pseudoroseomonas oryzae]KAA2212174.1 2,4-dihydroxyhept-2-ene-1,7-dioic acid aldolase [Pseudoroseomonas oryzae]
MNDIIRRRRSEGRAVLNGWLSIPSGVTAEVMAHAGWDTLTIDLQHGLIDLQCAIQMLQAIGTDKTLPLARPAWNEPGQIMKLLDAGAMGIICPMVNTAEEARRLVAACRYAPLGERSFGPVRASLVHGPGYWASANETILVLAMIETRRALDNLDEILAVEGLDGIYVGPADLGLSLFGDPDSESEDERAIAAIAGVRQKAQAAGKIAALHNLTPDHARRMAGQGWDFVTCGSDMRTLIQGAAENIRRFRAQD